MNITRAIAMKIGGEIETLINSNLEIQFYSNYNHASNSNRYQWRDGRFKETCDVWNNKEAQTRDELIIIFKKHLERK